MDFFFERSRHVVTISLDDNKLQFAESLSSEEREARVPPSRGNLKHGTGVRLSLKVTWADTAEVTAVSQQNVGTAASNGRVKVGIVDDTEGEDQEKVQITVGIDDSASTCWSVGESSTRTITIPANDGGERTGGGRSNRARSPAASPLAVPAGKEAGGPGGFQEDALLVVSLPCDLRVLPPTRRLEFSGEFQEYAYVIQRWRKCMKGEKYCFSGGLWLGRKMEEGTAWGIFEVLPKQGGRDSDIGKAGW